MPSKDFAVCKVVLRSALQQGRAVIALAIMKKPLSAYVFKSLLFIIVISFLAGVTITITAGSSSPQAFAAPTTNNSGYLMLGGSDFAVRNLFFNNEELNKLGLGIIEGAGYSAPLHLPQGAKVTQITTYYTATNPISFTTYITVESQRFDVFNPIAVSVITSISSTGNQTHITQSLNSPAIENSQYAYRVRIRTDGSGPSESPTAVPCPQEQLVVTQLKQTACM